MKLLKGVTLGLFLVCGLVANAQAEKYAVGLQSGFTGTGVSGKYFMSDKMAANLIVSGGFGFSTLTGRGLFTFAEEDVFDVYGIGEVGMWILSGADTYFSLGAGVGVVADWSHWIEDVEPIYWNLEIGVGSALGYTYTPIRASIGVHYRFDM